MSLDSLRVRLEVRTAGKGGAPVMVFRPIDLLCLPVMAVAVDEVRKHAPYDGVAIIIRRAPPP